jgi:hypothetical protein
MPLIDAVLLSLLAQVITTAAAGPSCMPPQLTAPLPPLPGMQPFAPNYLTQPPGFMQPFAPNYLTQPPGFMLHLPGFMPHLPQLPGFMPPPAPGYLPQPPGFMPPSTLTTNNSTEPAPPGVEPPAAGVAAAPAASTIAMPPMAAGVAAHPPAQPIAMPPALDGVGLLAQALTLQRQQRAAVDEGEMDEDEDTMLDEYGTDDVLTDCADNADNAGNADNADMDDASLSSLAPTRVYVECITSAGKKVRRQSCAPLQRRPSHNQ